MFLTFTARCRRRTRLGHNRGATVADRIVHLEASASSRSTRHRLESAEERRLCVVAATPAESRMLRRKVAHGSVISPRRGMYARSDYWDGLDPCSRALHVARTLALNHPTWILSHASAALAHGLEVPYRVATPIHYVTHHGGGGRAGDGLVHHRRKSLEWGTLDGILVSSPAQTVCDCAAEYSLPDALAIVDSALRRGAVTPEQLAALLSIMEGTRGIARARRTIAHADPRAENGGESVVRGTLIEAGFEIHDVQLVVANLASSGRTHRIDIVLKREDGLLIAVEVDGRIKYEELAEKAGVNAVEVMMRERQREALVTAHGMPVVRIGGRQIYDQDLMTRRLAAYGLFPKSDRKGD